MSGPASGRWRSWPAAWPTTSARGYRPCTASWYHRVLAQSALVPTKWLERALVTLGLPAGTPIQWAGNHRFHPAPAHRPGDPHSPREGFWHAHNGWYIGRKDAPVCLAYALAGPLRVLFDGWHRPRTNQQHNHLAPEVAADPWYRLVSRPGAYLTFAALHVALFFGGRVLALRRDGARGAVALRWSSSSTWATPSTASRTSWA